MLMLNSKTYVYRAQGLPIPHSNSTCCTVASLDGLPVFRPDFMRVDHNRHSYVGNAAVNGTVCRVWYSPFMASTFWDRPANPKIILTEGALSACVWPQFRVFLQVWRLGLVFRTLTTCLFDGTTRQISNTPARSVLREHLFTSLPFLCSGCVFDVLL